MHYYAFYFVTKLLNDVDFESLKNCFVDMIDKLFLVQDFRAFITLPVPVTNQQQLNSQTPYYAIEL